jgi:hypothetical protein
MQTLAAPPHVINFEVKIPAALENSSAATTGFLALQKVAFNPEIITPNLSFGIYVDQTGVFNFAGWCIECDIDVFSNITLPALIGGFPTPELVNITSLG